MDQKCAGEVTVELWAPGAAVVRMQRVFKRAARKLREDYHLREDLVQEMSLAVVKCKRAHPLTFFLRRGICRAINFLVKWERNRKRTEPLDYEDERLTYDPAVLAERREAAIVELKRRGMGFLLKELAKIDSLVSEAKRLAA